MNDKQQTVQPGRHVVVVGTQWGDEGKGKLVDWLTETATGVVRFQGGHNAGHTLVINGVKTALDGNMVYDPIGRISKIDNYLVREAWVLKTFKSF